MTEQENLTPMMEVAVERSFDVLEKSWESRVFTKLYHSLRTSGLLAKLSDKDFRTLVCLSTFMDAQGRCYQKAAREIPASILLRARGEVLEERNIKRSRGAMFAYLGKKHVDGS